MEKGKVLMKIHYTKYLLCIIIDASRVKMLLFLDKLLWVIHKMDKALVHY